MSTRTRTPLVAVAAALVLFATACGGGSATSVDAAESPGDTPSVSSSESETTSSAPTESPIGDLLGIPITNDDEMQEYFGQLQRDAELKISECMLTQGFQYQAVDYSSIDGLDANIDEDSREFAEEYGFGIASNPFEEAFESFESFEDPNNAHVESLTEGEREAYQTALNGEFPDFNSSEELDNFTPGGCQGEAYDEVFSFGLVFDQFGNEFEEIEEAFDSDQRIVAATAGWGGCMAEAGYQFADQDDAEADINRRYRAIVNDPDAFDSDGEDQSITVESPGEEEVFFGPSTLAPAFQERVDALAVEERAIGLATWECNAPLREIEGDIQIEYEQKFVDQHGEAIRAALDS